MKRAAIDDIAAIDGEAQSQDENRSVSAPQWNNGGLLRQQRTSDRQQSSRAHSSLWSRNSIVTNAAADSAKTGTLLSRDCARHRANSCLVIVIDRAAAKG